MPSNLLIWGRGGHGAIVDEAARLAGYGCKGEIDKTDDNDPQSKRYLERWPKDQWRVHVAIGDNTQRSNVFNRLKADGYIMETIIHPKAFISPSVKIGVGCYVGPMATVLTRTVIGSGVIINTTASVDHDCILDDFVHIAPGAHLCGSVKIGKQTLVAVGGVVVPNITIGSNCTLGASSALVETIEGNNLTMWGIPARVVK